MDGKIYGYGKEMNELKDTNFNIENDPEFYLHPYEEFGANFAKKVKWIFRNHYLRSKGEEAVSSER